MTSDPISDFIIRIQNASAVGAERVDVPYSKLIFAIANALQSVGLISEVDKQGKKEKKIVSFTFPKSVDKTIKKIFVKRISKPGRRLYRNVKEIRPVRNGAGFLFLSTPKGIMSGAIARKENVGGEVLFEIWK